MDKIKIQDESGDKKYFSQLPHYILNHSTAIDQALYWQMKRYAGEGGRCFATQETLMKKMGVGIKAFKKSLKYLLDKGWIKYVGMTGGRTRPIKTYAIVDIWKLNILHYEEIVVKRTVSFSKEIPAERTVDTSQKNSKIPAERTVEEDLVEEDIIKNNYNCKQSSLIVEIFNIFKEINPTINYGNKTQRSAVSEMIKKIGFEKTKRSALYAVSVQNQPYTPTITSPYQLKTKLGDLIAYHSKEKNKNKINIIDLDNL